MDAAMPKRKAQSGNMKQFVEGFHFSAFHCYSHSDVHGYVVDRLPYRQIVTVVVANGAASA